MKNSYKLIVLILTVVNVSMFFTSCKRGDDDPFFSFRSRKDRVAGYWKISNFESNILKTIGTQQLKANVLLTITDDKVTIKIDSIDTPHDTTKNYTGVIKESEYRFDKNSKMTHTLKYEIVEEKTTVNENTNTTCTIERWVTTIDTKGNGTWNFLGRVEINGIDKYKDKERIAFIYENKYTKIDSIYTKRIYNDEMIEIAYQFKTISHAIATGYANGQLAEVWVIRELSKQ